MAGEVTPEASTSNRVEDFEMPRNVVRPERGNVADKRVLLRGRAHPCQRPGSKEASCGRTSASCSGLDGMTAPCSLFLVQHALLCSPCVERLRAGLLETLVIPQTSSGCDRVYISELGICAGCHVMRCGRELRSLVRRTCCLDAPG